MWVQCWFNVDPMWILCGSMWIHFWLHIWFHLGFGWFCTLDQLDPSDTFFGKVHYSFWARKKLDFLTYHISVIFHKRCLPFLWPTFFRVCEIQFFSKIVKILWPTDKIFTFDILDLGFNFQTYNFFELSSVGQTFSAVEKWNSVQFCTVFSIFKTNLTRCGQFHQNNIK